MSNQMSKKNNNHNSRTNKQNTASIVFTTMNRKLEQVLYNHGIMFIGQHKNEDGMTVWTYVRTKELEQIVSQFRSFATKKRPQMRLAYAAPETKYQGGVGNV